ncbi:MAG: hypothetical protein Q8P81_00125 [Nanoarchaeota archaeon]|nr:hypothetical protein [Nanoarchaeota archaeon]
MIKESEIPILRELALRLEKAFVSLKEAHKKNEPEKFNNAKKIIIQIQKKISEIIEQ